MRWVVLRGPVLGTLVYRRRGLRPYGDLDVLVHPADLGRVIDHLVPGRARLVHRNWAHLAASSSGELTLRLPLGTPLDMVLAVMLGRVAGHLDPEVARWLVPLRRTAWGTFAGAVSRWRPPGAGLLSSHSGATVFESTRGSSVVSVWRLAEQLVRNRALARGWREPPDGSVRSLPMGGAVERRRWVAAAQRHG